MQSAYMKKFLDNLRQQFSEMEVITGVKLFVNDALQSVNYDAETGAVTTIVNDTSLFAQNFQCQLKGEWHACNVDYPEQEGAASYAVAVLCYFYQESCPSVKPSEAADLSEGSWWAYLSQKKFERPASYPNMARHRVIYVIDQDPESQQYRVNVKKSYLTKANKFTKIEDLPISVLDQDPLPKFIAPEDRRILHLMHEACDDDSDRQSDIFYLERIAGPVPAMRLFSYIIKTGRSFWQNTESSPLVYKAQDSHHLNNPWFRITKVFGDYYLNMDTGHCGPLADENYQDETTPAENDQTTPVPYLTLRSRRIDTPWLDSILTEVNFAEVAFQYSDIALRPEMSEWVLESAKLKQSVKRNMAQEFTHLMELDVIKPVSYVRDATIADGFHESDFVIPDETQWLEFLVMVVPRLKKAGWKTHIDKSFGLLVQKIDEWYGIVNQQEQSGWFDISIGVIINGERVNVLPLILEQLKLLPNAEALNALKEKADDELFVISRKEGERIGLPMGRIKPILNTLVELLDGKSLNTEGDLQFTTQQLGQLSAIEDNFHQAIQWQGNYDIQARLKKLATFKQLEPVAVEPGFNAKLRDYQQLGLSWLQFLVNYELGGILADDMGLGKTIQTLAHLLKQHQRSETQNPSIVIAPTSLMANWSKEARTFAPALKVLVLHGSERKNYFDQIPEHDLILTTYPLLVRDAEQVLAYEYHLAILDEAQVIKNSRSKMAQTAYQVRAEHRLCLTGTPVENHLGELWSLFNFLMPKFLGDEEQFTRLFRIPIERQNDEGRRTALINRVKPFLLRRTKAAVVSELPPKTVIEELIELDDEQSMLYEAIRIAMHQRIQSAITANGIGKSNLVISDALLKLRQVCCAPSLVKLESAQGIEASAKLDWITTMLPSMVEEGRRILLFSQFTEMLKLIQARLDELGIEYVKLTGSTKNRELPVTRFQEGKVPVFLISLKAGGTGLNLTAADTVIHYDPWWNPAAENQASDRAHRIGQENPVFVYKLICKNTVEERIQSMQQRKQALADSIYGKGTGSGGFSQSDLNQLFEPLS